MLERFVKEARAVVADAVEEARALGSPTVEAEHILLALTRDAHGIAGAVLGRAGLDHATVLDALEMELERSLEAVGVSAGGFDLPARVPTAHRPRWGTSAKTSLERVVKVTRDRGDRRIGSGHLLLALLAAREGTVPRALRGADVDPQALAAATHAALDRR